MYFESIELNNFRNYKELHLQLEKKANLLYGDNAQGKTNILEALYYCATSKSHRGSKDREIINFESDESHIRVKLVKKDVPYLIDIHLKKNHPKGIAVNGSILKKASDLFGLASVVCFSPEDLDIIKAGPAARRKFIDIELCQLDPIYVHALVNYNKTLIQKNKILKEIYLHNDYEMMLDVYDDQLRKFGSQIIEIRKTFINKLNEIIKDIHFNLTGDKEIIELKYEINEWQNMREAEIKQKTCLSGPHRDDIGFFINGMDVRKYGSQGQQRTTALSLKLAEIKLVKERNGDYPVLLLDDVLSELDTGRQNKILSVINDVQTIITCTGVEDFINNNFQIARTMYVKNGIVEVMEA